MALELHHDFTFNPDGSGRVHLRWIGPGGADAPPPADFVRTEIERAQGVAAWAGVRCEPEDDRLVFEAVAWFRDPTELRFHCQGFHVSLLDFEVGTADDGGVRIATRMSPQSTSAPREAPVDAEETAALLAAEREKLAMARPFLAEIFGGLRCSAVLRAPGTLTEVRGGERLDDGAVRIEVDGSELVAALDRLQGDDDLLLRVVLQGGLTPETAFATFGVQGPVQLRTLPDAVPQFDWEQEVAEAREAFAPFLEAMGAAVPSAEPAAPLANVRVVASRVVLEADPERDFTPQGQGQPGLELTIAGDLDVSVLSIDDAEYDRLLASDGADLRPADSWDRRCHFPKQTNDGRTVWLDFKLPLPAAAGFAAFAGRLQCLVSEGAELVDLELPELAEGAGSDVLGARVLRVEEDHDGNTTLEVRVHLARERVLGAAVHASGEAMPLAQIGYSSFNDQCEFTWRASGSLPRDARLVLTCAAGLRRLAYSFSLSDFDLLGRPLPRV